MKKGGLENGRMGGNQENLILSESKIMDLKKFNCIWFLTKVDVLQPSSFVNIPDGELQIIKNELSWCDLSFFTVYLLILHSTTGDLKYFR